MKTLSPAQSLILDISIASLHFLKEAAVANKCTIDELSEDQLRSYATSQSQRKK